jgi:hypothetical protein
MYCPSCGKEIPAHSAFCLHCGQSVSNPSPGSKAGLGVIRLRRASRYAYSAVAFDVYIDGHPAGEIHSGQTQELQMMPGTHTIFLRFESVSGKTDSNVLTVTMGPDQMLSVLCKFKGGWFSSAIELILE